MKNAKAEEKSVETVEAVSTKARNESVNDGGYFADFDFSSLEVSLEEMFKHGVHFGHSKSRKHPQMDEYIYGTRNGISIIDLEKAAVKLKESLDFIRNVAAEGQEIVFVGTKKQAKKLVESAAKRCSMPYINERWLGGTFTNFPIISARTKFLREGADKLEKGEFSQYTKLEKFKITEELNRLEVKMGGIKNMSKLPGAILVVGALEDNLAIKEARMKNIPVVAIADSNVDTRNMDYIIPANDDAVSSIKLILAYVVKAVLEVQANIVKTSVEK